MKKLILSACLLGIIASGCDDAKPSNGNTGGFDGPVVNPQHPGTVPGSVPGDVSSTTVESWQVSALGQEGHGGDAVVCFGIPAKDAVYKSQINGGSGTVWRLTNAGRQSIQSAKPLEQYLAERVASKKPIIDHLNTLSVEDGYRETLQPFLKLPGAFARIRETHRKLGWLAEDGISSEYGLLDINDSGFLGESEIDRTHCRELQAVVRRDNQLWYDADIVTRFDHAGQVLMQLHEELYAWGKWLDETNRANFGPAAHDTSAKTRRMILKILGDAGTPDDLASNLKSMGFSVSYWATHFLNPVAPGSYMTTAQCESERAGIRAHIAPGNGGSASQQAAYFFFSRYLSDESGSVELELRYNFPEILSKLMAFTFSDQANTWEYDQQALAMMDELDQPGACEGSF